MKNSEKNSKHRKCAFRARKTLQKLGYTVLGQKGAPVLDPPPALW